MASLWEETPQFRPRPRDAIREDDNVPLILAKLEHVPVADDVPPEFAPRANRKARVLVPEVPGPEQVFISTDQDRMLAELYGKRERDTGEKCSQPYKAVDEARRVHSAATHSKPSMLSSLSSSSAAASSAAGSSRSLHQASQQSRKRAASTDLMISNDSGPSAARRSLDASDAGESASRRADENSIDVAHIWTLRDTAAKQAKHVAKKNAAVASVGSNQKKRSRRK